MKKIIYLLIIFCLSSQIPAQSLREQLLIPAPGNSAAITTSAKNSVGQLRLPTSISAGSPIGFGLSNRELAVGVLYTSLRDNSSFGGTIIEDADAVAVVGIGFGQPDRLAAEFSINISSTKLDSDFGEGNLELKLHRRFGNGSLAVAYSTLATWGNGEDFSDTYYVAYSQLFPGRFPVAISLGAGNGELRRIEDIQEDNDTISPFGSLAINLRPDTALLAGWTGRQFNAGLSLVPLHKYPLTINLLGANLTEVDNTPSGYIVSFSYWLGRF